MKSNFNTEQWEVIRNSPLVVFFIVAKADGQVDSDEVEKLIGLFRKPENYGSQIFAEIIAEMMSDAGALDQTIARILTSEATDFSESMANVQQLVDTTMDAGESELFKRALLTLGTDIARASGDQDNPVSPEEREELATLKSILKI